MIATSEYNPKLFSYGGILGRYGYFLNLLHIYALSIIFTTPYSFWVMTKIETYSDAFNVWKFFASAPPFLKFWTLTGIIIITYTLIINSFKRMNDIFGEEKKSINITYAVLILINLLCSFFFHAITFLLTPFLFVVKLILIFKHGKITSTEPYDYKKEFNWGAFLGTWLWGIYNKSFIPLLNIVLFFTPLNLYFSLYCGMKGNEWAYKNKKWNNVDKFNESQEKQTTFWAVFNLLLIPVLFFAGIFAATFTVIKSAAENPESAKKIESSFNNFANTYISTVFVNKEITATENKFYVDENEWSSYSFKDKMNLLNAAASFSAMEKSKNPQTFDRNKYYDKMTELPVTKIYSAQNPDKLLGEFKEIDFENKSFTEQMKQAMNSYKFYN